jgi:hypothetical protein
MTLSAGREAIVAMLGPGDFFGEGCLAGDGLKVNRTLLSVVLFDWFSVFNGRPDKGSLYDSDRDVRRSSRRSSTSDPGTITREPRRSMPGNGLVWGTVTRGSFELTAAKWKRDTSAACKTRSRNG